MTLQELHLHILKHTDIDVKSKSRKRPIPVAKKVFIQIAHLLNPNLTHEKIGEFLNLDHSTITSHMYDDLKYDLIVFPVLDRIYHDFFPRKEKTKQDYIEEIESLK